jgi:hypothetical protein
MSRIEVRTVVRVVQEPLWRVVLALLASNWILAALGGEVAHAGERFGVGVVREIEVGASYQAYNWHGAAAISLVVAASWLGAWIALSSTNAKRLGPTQRSSQGLVNRKKGKRQ